MRTIKKLTIGLALLAVSVMDASGQEEDGKIPTTGARIAGEPRGYLVKIDSKSEGDKGVYTFHAEDRKFESVTRIQHHGEIEDLHTLQIPLGMVNLSQIEIITSGLREIHLSHDTSLDMLAPTWDGYSFDLPRHVLTITTSARTLAKDTNWNQIYLIEPTDYHDGYEEPKPISITAGISIFAPEWLKDRIRHYGGSGEHREEVLKMLHPEIHYDTRFVSIIHWRAYLYREGDVDDWGRLYDGGHVYVSPSIKRIKYEGNLSALERFRKREADSMFLISFIGSYSVKHSVRLPEYIRGLSLPALVRRDPETGETITVPPLPTIITTNKVYRLKPQE